MHAPAPDCEAFADLLDAQADGALPPSAAQAVAAHLAACPHCAAEVAAIGALRAELAALPRPEPPPALAHRIRAALPAPPPRLAARREAFGLLAAGVAGLTIGGVGGWLLRGVPPVAGHDLLAAHRRGLLGGAPAQVASSDSHSVRPWLAERLPLSPNVPLPPGFPLQGARLDLVDGRVVAAVLYRRRAHLLTLFATAAPAPGWPTEVTTRQGFTLWPWIAEGVHYVAISDIPPSELAEFAAAN